MLAFRGSLRNTIRTMRDDQFTRLFKYMQEFRQDIQGEFAKVNSRIDTLHGAVDALQKQSETHEQERLFTSHQVDRHESWIKQLAKQSKTKRKPEP